MRIAAPEYGTVRYIVENMREWDRREVFATHWGDDPDQFTKEAVAVGQFAWVCGLERPIAYIGAYPLWPGVWSVWMYATDEIRHIGKSLTKHVRKVMIPALLAGEFHRGQCCSLAGHTEAHDWLRVLGASPEATLRGYGRKGEDFVIFAWDRASCERAKWKEKR